ncbi:hypothetical protein [Ensifer adhaerens]|uniref:hypothetical protein n=1 Tax=Ensifer adhaerens TaxID=106592 RepID=UPI000CF06EA8|nr:hypothetical protein [Ensifer adhaerens]
MRTTLVIAAFLVMGLSSDAVAKTWSFNVTRKTEHKIGEIYGLGGQKFCVWAYQRGTRTYSHVSVRRSLNGHEKFLYRIKGKHCWKSKAGAYIVYGAAGDVDLKVIFEIPGGEDWRPSGGGVFEPPT